MENTKEIPVRVTDAKVIADDKVLITCEVDIETARLLTEPKLSYSVSVKEVDGL